MQDLMFNGLDEELLPCMLFSLILSTRGTCPCEVLDSDHVLIQKNLKESEELLFSSPVL